MHAILYILILFVCILDVADFDTVAVRNRKHTRVKHSHRNKSVSVYRSEKPALAFVFSTTVKPSIVTSQKPITTHKLSREEVRKKQKFLKKERIKLRKLLKNKKARHSSAEVTSILSKINQINEELKKYGSKYGKKRRRLKKPLNYSKTTTPNASILEVTTAKNKNYVFKWSLRNDTSLSKIIMKLNKDPEQNFSNDGYNAQSDGLSPPIVKNIFENLFVDTNNSPLETNLTNRSSASLVKDLSPSKHELNDNSDYIKVNMSDLESPENLALSKLNEPTASLNETIVVPLVSLTDKLPNINYSNLLTIRSTTMPSVKNLSLNTILNEFNAMSDQMNDVLPGPNTYRKINMTRKTTFRKNINRCSIRKGGCEHLCHPRGPNKCLCMPGFVLSRNGRSCVDIDECARSNGGCKGICKNTPGSYYCTCTTGLRLSDDKKSCEDINECLLRNGHGPCQDTCVNNYGSYECSCAALRGTHLSTDKHSCEDINECIDNKLGCSHDCVNTLGRAFCTCPNGMILDEDWKTCLDINECDDEEVQKQCKYGCLNSIGSYRCIEPYELQNDEILLSISDYVACPPLFPPNHGFLECSREKGLEIKAKTKSGRRRVTNRPGTFCQLICPDGYKIINKYKVTCSFDGKWLGEKSGKCERSYG